jgi:cytochrome c oxidase cbb3-type subunit I/II
MSILDHHKKIETHATLLLVLSFLVVSIGGLVQIVPLFYLENTIEEVEGVRPYSPLELAGRDIYVREGCYTCHSQMIRPFVSEVLRYGDYSRLGESVYDHPFQWGSRRIGPDLARVGGKYSDIWHYLHMDDPRQLSPGSNMPRYPWLFTANTDVDALPSKIRVQRILGVPYPPMTAEAIQADVRRQAEAIAAGLSTDVDIAPEREIVALIAYLQQLGKSAESSPGDLADTR